MRFEVVSYLKDFIKERASENYYNGSNDYYFLSQMPSLLKVLNQSCE